MKDDDRHGGGIRRMVKSWLCCIRQPYETVAYKWKAASLREARRCQKCGNVWGKWHGEA